MEYRIDRERLLDVIGGWDSYLRKKVRLIACGGTAMTLLGAKLFRGAEVDFEDCLALMKSKGGEIDIEHLKARFHETASYDISEERVTCNLERFLGIVSKEGLTGGK